MYSQFLKRLPTCAVFARVIVTATVALAIVLMATPLAPLSPVSLCAMACCAGKEPHEAGACMHTACEIHLPQAQPEPEESLCGAHSAENGPQDNQQYLAPVTDAEAIIVVATQQESLQPYDHSDNSDSVAASTVSTPCPPGCGASVFTSRGQNRSRDSIISSHSERQRPGSSIQFPDAARLIKILTAQYRQCAARAPPLLVS